MLSYRTNKSNHGRIRSSVYSRIFTDEYTETVAVSFESIYHLEQWLDYQLTKDVLADLAKIGERIQTGSLAFDFQNDISKAESKLLEAGNVEACLLLSKLSLVHMIELGMTDSNDREIARMLKDIPASRIQDFTPLLTKLIDEVRSGNSG